MTQLHDEVERATIDAMNEASGRDVPLIPPAFTRATDFGQSTRESRDAAGIESLYDDFPIGDGNHRIRVTRLQPEKWDGVQVSGVIDEFTEKIDTLEFGKRYGGGVYRVQVLGYEVRPGRGETVLRAKREVTVKIPGKPNPMFFNVRGEGADDMAGMTGMAEIMRENQRQMADVQKPNVELMRAAQEMAASRAAEVRDTMNGQVMSLQAEVQRLQSLLTRSEEKVRQLGDEIVKIQRETDKRLSDAEMQRVQELRQQHESMTREARDKHEEELRRVRDDAARQQSDMRQRYDEQISSMRQSWDSERQQLMVKAGEDVRAAHQAAESRHASLKEMYDLQLNELRRSTAERIEDYRARHDTELRSLQAGQALQVDSIKSNESMRAQSVVDSAQQRVLYTEKMLGELRAELKALKDENKQLRDEKFKPVHVAIAEAKQIVEMVGGGAPGAEGPEEDDKPKTWQDRMVEIAMALAPALAGRLAPAEPPPPGGAGAPALPQRAQQQQAQAQAQHEQQRRRAARPPAPGAWSPPVPGARMPPAPDYPVAPAARPSVIPMGAAHPTATGSVVSPMSAGLEPAAVAIQQDQAAVAAVQQAVGSAPAAGPAPAGPAGMPSDGQMQALILELDRVIANDEKSAEDFAREFVAGVGPDVARQVLDALAPEQLVAFVQQTPGGDRSAIVTLQGRRYLTELWRVARQMVAAA